MRLKLKMILLLYIATPIAANETPDYEALRAKAMNIENLAYVEGPFSPNLFDPLMQIAKLQLNLDKKRDAIDSLQRAQNIAHRNEGVYSRKQLPIISILISLAMNEKEYQNANRQKRFAFFISTRAFEPNSPEFLNAYAELADWYMNTGQSRRASNLIEEAIAHAISNNQDPLPFKILDNQAYRLEGNCCNPKKLINAITERTENVLPETLHTAYLEIADTLILGGKALQATNYFKKANEIYPLDSPARPLAFRRNVETKISTQSNHYQVARNMPLAIQNRLRMMTRQEQLEAHYREPQWFQFDPEDRHRGFETRDVGEAYSLDKRTHAMVGHPILFDEDQLDQLLPIRWKKNKEGLSTTLSFTVSKTGDLKNIEIMESNAPSRLNRLLTRVLRRSYYRPALKSGKPTESQNVTLLQTFAPREPTAQ